MKHSIKETLMGHEVVYSPELPPDNPAEKLAEGLWAWTNIQNGFRVVLLHFTADPKKRSQEFVETAKKGMPSLADYEREYNIRWQSFRGKPVYEDDFKRSFHVAQSPLRYASHLPIVRGWDFGLYPACVFTQLWPGMRLVVLREITEKGMGLERFLEEVKAKSLEWFPTHRHYIEVVDPAGFARSPNDERTAVSLLTNPNTYGLKVIPGIQIPATRFNRVREFLKRAVRGEPALLLDPTCKMLIQGFEGGYHYEFNPSGQLRDKPEKNEYSHPHDALQYICTRILEIDLTGQQSNVQFRQPTYRFNKAEITNKGTPACK